jgi:hypothetical protein
MLLNGLSVTRNTSKAAIVSAEVLGGGYLRASYAPSGGVFDSGQNRYELSTVNVDISISGTSIQWSSVVLFADAAAVHALTMGAINTSTDRITITAHGLTSATEVAVTTTTVLPGGLSPTRCISLGLLMRIRSSLHTTSALNSIVDITTAGTGTHSLRNATGTPFSLRTLPLKPWVLGLLSRFASIGRL